MIVGKQWANYLATSVPDNKAKLPTISEVFELMLIGLETNRDGLGAVCRVEIGDQISTTVHDGKSGYLSQSRMPLYFGLGESEQVDRIIVEWPSGKRQVMEGPIQSNQTLLINEASTSTN